MAAEFALLTVFAYLLGSVPASYLAARWSRGVDIRKYGSGNVGLGNLWELVSRKVAMPVIIFDLGKGAAIVWTAQLSGLGVTQQVIAGLAAIIGHNWPVFLRFNGGRGILTTMGVVFALMPWGIAVILVASSFTLLIGSSPLPVLGGLAVLPLFSWWLGEPLAVTLGFAAIALITILRRLTAPLSAGGAATGKKQLLLNRLLFDRDIRDREEWIYQLPPDASPEERARAQKKRQKRGIF